MDNSKVESHSIEEEFQEIDTENNWNNAYQKIKLESMSYDYSVEEAKRRKNKDLNRYRDVSPYDHSRIILQEGECDYINASLVKVDLAHRRYILTQGPLSGTAGHFWLMVWEQLTTAVIMLNKVIERNQIKCHQYFPLGEGGGKESMMMHFPDVDIKVEYISETDHVDFTIRTLLLSHGGKSREVLHFHYTTWPDFHVPDSQAFLRFLWSVRESGTLSGNVGPPVIHCSAGIGRSGTLCLVDSCLVMIEEHGEKSVKIRDVLMEMRKFRMGLIQTHSQLRFSYLAIIEGIKILKGETVLPKTPTADRNHVEAEAPPPPPPRSDSLKDSSQESSEPSVPSVPLDKDIGSRPLPAVPPADDSTSVSEISESDDLPPLPDSPMSEKAPPLPPEPNPEEVVRQRKKKQEELAEKIATMKRKQVDAETWQQRKRFLCQPITLGMVGILLIGTTVLCYKYFSFR